VKINVSTDNEFAIVKQGWTIIKDLSTTNDGPLMPPASMNLQTTHSTEPVDDTEPLIYSMAEDDPVGWMPTSFEVLNLCNM